MMFRNMAVTAAIACCAVTASIHGSAQDSDNDRLRRDLDQKYIIGPTTSSQLDYRIDYQNRVPMRPGDELAWLTVKDGAIYVVDTSNRVTRLDAENGNVLWSKAAGSSIHPVHGIDRATIRMAMTDGSLADQDVVLVTKQTGIYVHQDSDGSLIQTQDIDRMPSTSTTVGRNHIIYGTNDGRIVWHQFRVGYPWKANQISGKIIHTPVLVDDEVYGVSVDGDIIAMDNRTTNRIWDKRLISGIQTRPIIGDDIVFVAGTDQYLWALDRADGRTIWKYFASSPLMQSPTLLGDRIYQQVDGEGLLCLTTMTPDKIDGDVVWKQPEVTGNVITSNKDHLWAWDQASRVMWVLDATNGNVISRTSMPLADFLFCTTREDGQFYALNRDGRVERLSPR